MNNLLGQDPPLVLVIDDEQGVLDEVAAALASASIACRTCMRADEALATALQTPPDLILCDMNSFGENGPETCERIKQQPGLEDVPIIFLSASQTPDIIRRSHGSCTTYCVRKPFDPVVLVGLIDTAIRTQPLMAADAV